MLSVFDIKSTRMGLGESLLDTARMAGYYADLVVARHPDDAVMKQIARTLRVPLINAGEGRRDHPTQTLIDLYTIYDRFGTVDGLRIGLVGGVRYSRAARSLLAGLRRFRGIELHLVEAVSEADEGGGWWADGAAREHCTDASSH